MAVNTLPSLTSPTVSKTICRIVGLVCLAGFFIDVLALAVPPNPLSLEWRVSLLQQLGDRSIVLLFGSALLMYGVFDDRRVLRRYSLAMLAVGVFFFLTSALVIRDSLVLQNQAIQSISNQASQLQTRIQQAQTNPGSLPENVTPEQLTQASQQLVAQAESLKQNARADITRLGFASIGNLVVVGMGLISLGRLGLKRR